MNLILCDNCKTDTKGMGLSVSCGYGSYRDGENLEFCCDECMVMYFTKEIERAKRLIDEYKRAEEEKKNKEGLENENGTIEGRKQIIEENPE